MKLLILGCKTLREGVVVSVIFFIAGILLTLAALYIVPTWLHMNHVVLLLGFVLLLVAPIVLLSTFLLSVLPGVEQNTDQCER